MLTYEENKRGLAAGDFLWYLLYTIVIVGFLSVYYYFIIAPTDISVEGYEFAMGKVQANSVMTEILTSPDCLSTGNMAVLSEEKLDRKNGVDVLDCAYHPSVWTYLKVTDHEKNIDYEFGDDGIRDLLGGDITKWEIPVTIDTGSGKNLGTATFSMLHPPHFAASATRAGKIAWYDGGSPLELQILYSDKNHDIESDKGKEQDDLEIYAEIEDKASAALPFKGYSLQTEIDEFDDDGMTSATKYSEEGYVEIGGDTCTYEPWIFSEIHLYHGETRSRSGRRDLCCWEGDEEKCGPTDSGDVCGEMYVCDCYGGCTWERK